MRPQDAAWAVAKVYNEGFGFQTRNGDGQWWQSEQVEKHDYFYASVNALTAHGEQIATDLQWKRDGETSVTLKSNLPSSEHALVVQRVKAALEATTQPTASR
jgi:hypothetical protein